MTQIQEPPTYVEDGRECQIVTVAELLPGDEILGWQGEEWTFGTVREVVKSPRMSYGGEIRYDWTILYESVDQPPTHYAKGTDWRRISKRGA